MSSFSESAGRGRTPRWSALVQHSTEPMFALNARQRLVFANAAWESLAGVSFAEVRGHSCKERTLNALMPPKEVMDGNAGQVRRRIAGRWCDILFVPWKKQERVYVVLGKIAAVPDESRRLSSLPDRLTQLQAFHSQAYGLDAWRAETPQTRLWLDQIRLAAGSNLPVLIEGPTGAGKEWLARTIHHASARRGDHFAALDVAVLPAALLQQFLERAPSQRIGGVFVRHAERLGTNEQRMLLAQWDDGASDAPRCYFGAADAAPGWLPEFQHRIRPLTIHLPGLKDRPEEMDRLVALLLPDANRHAGGHVAALTEEARTILKLHDWPRSLVELREVLLAACKHARGSHLDAADLPLYLRQTPVTPERRIDLDAILEKVERRLIESALERAGRNKSKAAELLGIWRARLLRRVEQWKLD